MELSQLFSALSELARGAGAEIRDVRFDPAMRALSEGKRARGGLCRVRGRAVILVDTEASLPEKIAIVARAAGSLGVDTAGVHAVVRATIRTFARGPSMGTRTPQPLARAIRTLPRSFDSDGARVAAATPPEPRSEE